MCQDEVHNVNQLPKEVKETSGLIFFYDHFWTHNDSGGQPVLYAIDRKTGEITHRVFIRNAQNIDWEDITQDDDHVYIADTGNNLGKRQKFQIYKVSKSDIQNSLLNKQQVSAEIIEFSFKRQPSNLKRYRHNFDIEAICIVKGKLMFFTKNWANSKTSLYGIEKGIAKKIKTYNPDGLITGATYHNLSNSFYLSGYHKYTIVNNKLPFIFLISDFDTTDEKEKIFLLKSQKGYQVESIEVVNDKIYFSNEVNKKSKQALW